MEKRETGHASKVDNDGVGGEDLQLCLRNTFIDSHTTVGGLGATACRPCRSLSWDGGDPRRFHPDRLSGPKELDRSWEKHCIGREAALMDQKASTSCFLVAALAGRLMKRLLGTQKASKSCFLTSALLATFWCRGATRPGLAAAAPNTS